MAGKKTATTKAPKGDAPVKFVKGAFYEDQKKNLWYCTSPKQKKTPDGHMVVLMQRTEDGVQVGEPGEEYVDTFVRQLTKAELKEYREACPREKEALAEADGTVSAAKALLEAREDQMVTAWDWDRLRRAVEAVG